MNGSLRCLCTFALNHAPGSTGKPRVFRSTPTTMPWPPRVLSQFAKAPNAPLEPAFHGPYNKLLCHLFPVDTEFTVVPQYLPGSRESGDFTIMFEVLFEDKPVFVLELKQPGNLRWDSTRETADRQIRSRLRDLARWSYFIVSDRPRELTALICSILSLARFAWCQCNGNPSLFLQGVRKWRHRSTPNPTQP